MEAPQTVSQDAILLLCCDCFCQICYQSLKARYIITYITRRNPGEWMDSHSSICSLVWWLGTAGFILPILGHFSYIFSNYDSWESLGSCSWWCMESYMRAEKRKYPGNCHSWWLVGLMSEPPRAHQWTALCLVTMPSLVSSAALLWWRHRLCTQQVMKLCL